MLIVAHGNSLRALVKYLDEMSDEEIAGLNIPTGIPLRYDLDADLRPLVAGGSYLDPDAAAAGAAAVASQGREISRADFASNLANVGVNGHRTPVS